MNVRPIKARANHLGIVQPQRVLDLDECVLSRGSGRPFGNRSQGGAYVGDAARAVKNNRTDTEAAHQSLEVQL